MSLVSCRPLVKAQSTWKRFTGKEAIGQHSGAIVRRGRTVSGRVVRQKLWTNFENRKNCPKTPLWFKLGLTGLMRMIAEKNKSDEVSLRRGNGEEASCGIVTVRDATETGYRAGYIGRVPDVEKS